MTPNDEQELAALIDVLPSALRAKVGELPLQEVLEIVLDLGRPPSARLVGRSVRLAEVAVTDSDLEHVAHRVGEFGGDNRAGLPGTLHRISAIRNRRGAIVGLTLRVGRAVYGTIDMLRDLVDTGLNLLLLGRPGVGKTTKLREVARVLADDLNKRVIVIDTSNEIGGDGDVPHPAIGEARRMQVPRPDKQHAVMIEAVENHMPEAIVIDEISTSEEAAAARTIAERGVQLIATAHGNTLENLILNPTLADLVGGVQTVTLSDEEARRRGTQKTVTERRAPPTFDIVVELLGRDEVMVHSDTADHVDRLLSGAAVKGERRTREGGEVKVEEAVEAHLVASPEGEPAPKPERIRVYGHGLRAELLEKVIRFMGARARVVDRPEKADLIIATRGKAGDTRLEKALRDGDRQLYVVKRGSTHELTHVLREALALHPGNQDAEVREAVAEAEHAIRRVLAESVAVPLAPRPPRLRRLQHALISRYHLVGVSAGVEPQRHLVVQPGDARLDVEQDHDESLGV